MNFIKEMANVLIARISIASLAFLVILACLSFGFRQTRAASDEMKPVFSSGHFNSLDKMFFSSDGKQLITGGIDRIIKVIDIETGRELRFINAEGQMRIVDYSAATDMVAAVVGLKVVVWDARSGNRIKTIEIERPPAAEKGITKVDPKDEVKSEIVGIESPRIDSIQFSPDGKFLAIQNDDAMVMWDVVNERILTKIAKSSASVAWAGLISFTPDSSHIYLENHEKIYLVEIRSGKSARNIEIQGHFYGGRLSPKGTVLYSPGWDFGLIEFWDSKTGKNLRSLKVSDIGSGTLVEFSPDESILAVSAKQGHVKLLNAKTFADIRDLGEPTKNTSSITFSPDGNVLATMGDDRNIRLWEHKTGKLIRTLGKSNHDIYSFDIDSSRNRLAIVDDDLPRFFDLSAPGKLKPFRAANKNHSSVRFSNDNNLLFVLGFILPKDETDDITKIITVFDGNAEEQVSVLTVGRALTSMDISKNGGLVAASNFEREIMVWESKTGKLLHKIIYSAEQIQYAYEMDVALSPDGKWLAASGGGHTKILILNTETGKTFEIENEQLIESLKFADNNQTLAALEEEMEVSRFDDVVLFDVVTRKRIIKLESDEAAGKESSPEVETSFDLVGEQANKPVELGFSPDGKFFARNYGGHQIKIWNTSDGKEVRNHPLPDWISFKGSFVLTEINDRKILIEILDDKVVFSDANTDKQLASLFIYGEVDWAVSTPDGRFDATDGALERIHFTDGEKIVFANTYKSKYSQKGLLQEVLSFDQARN